MLRVQYVRVRLTENIRFAKASRMAKLAEKT